MNWKKIALSIIVVIGIAAALRYESERSCLIEASQDYASCERAKASRPRIYGDWRDSIYDRNCRADYRKAAQSCEPLIFFYYF